MKNLMAGLVVLAVSTANAASFVPAVSTAQTMPAKRNIDMRALTAQVIAERAALGYHYASVDMNDTTWKEEKAIMKELQAAGYDVDFGNDHRVYGWNSLNGALVIRWVDRHTEPLFGDR